MIAGDPSEYVHRIGRAGRMGRRGEAALFLLPSESGYLDMLQTVGVEPNEAPLGSLLEALPAPSDSNWNKASMKDHPERHPGVLHMQGSHTFLVNALVNVKKLNRTTSQEFYGELCRRIPR